MIEVNCRLENMISWVLGIECLFERTASLDLEMKGKLGFGLRIHRWGHRHQSYLSKERANPVQNLAGLEHLLYQLW